MQSTAKETLLKNLEPIERNTATKFQRLEQIILNSNPQWADFFIVPFIRQIMLTQAPALFFDLQTTKEVNGET
jgi:hypothetical protein